MYITLFHESQSSPRVIKTTIQGTKARANYLILTLFIIWMCRRMYVFSSPDPESGEHLPSIGVRRSSVVLKRL